MTNKKRFVCERTAVFWGVVWWGGTSISDKLAASWHVHTQITQHYIPEDYLQSLLLEPIMSHFPTEEQKKRKLEVKKLLCHLGQQFL